VSADLHYGEETVWYLELTPPVSLSAYRQAEDIWSNDGAGLSGVFRLSISRNYWRGTPSLPVVRMGSSKPRQTKRT